MSIQNKVVLISGGSSGIGAALVASFAKAGATVYSLDKNKPSEPIEGVSYLLGDLTNSGDIERELSKIKSPIEVLVSGAGVMRRGTIFDSSEEDYDFLMDNNAKSAWLLIKYSKPKLVEKPTVLQISSVHALKTVPNPGLYTLAKKTTAALAEILALTCPDYTVKVVYPGPTLTPLLLTGRTDEDKERISKIAYKPAELAEKIIELIDSDNHTLRFNGDTWKYEVE